MNFNTKLYQYNQLVKELNDANDAYYIHNQPTNNLNNNEHYPSRNQNLEFHTARH